MPQTVHLEIQGPKKRELCIHAYAFDREDVRGDLLMFISSGKRELAQITLKMSNYELARQLAIAINKVDHDRAPR